MRLQVITKSLPRFTHSNVSRSLLVTKGSYDFVKVNQVLIQFQQPLLLLSLCLMFRAYYTFYFFLDVFRDTFLQVDNGLGERFYPAELWHCRKGATDLFDRCLLVRVPILVVHLLTEHEPEHLHLIILESSQ